MPGCHSETAEHSECGFPAKQLGVSDLLTTQRLTIRPIEADDWRAIQDIWKRIAASEYAQYDIPKATEDKEVQDKITVWASFAGSRNQQYYAVCLEEKVIGFVSFIGDGNTYDINFGFHSAYYHRGYAKESISALLQELRRKGTFSVTAGTGLSNRPSVGLLESLGFTFLRPELVTFFNDAQGNPIYFEGGVFERILQPQEIAKQVRRICRYEKILQEAQALLQETDASSDLSAFQPKLQKLSDYYGSDAWKADLQSDEDGLLPEGLPRGVLSEDGIYNVLEEFKERF